MTYRGISGAVRAAVYPFAAVVLALSACAEPPLDVVPPRTQITGRVVDAASNAPLPGAIVTTTPSTSAVEAASDGAFTITNVAAGHYQVRAARDSFEAAIALVSVREGETAVSHIGLARLAPELAVAPSSLDLGRSLDGATLAVRNRTAVGVVAWQAASSQPWLTVRPTAGTVATQPAELALVVDRSLLPAGVSVARLVVTSSAGSRTVDVRVEKHDPAAPRLLVGTSALVFDDTTHTLAVDIANGGGGTLAWQIATSVPWLSPSTSAGANAARIHIAVDRTGLASGRHSGTLTVTSSGGTASVDVTLSVGVVATRGGAWSVVATLPGVRPTSISVTGDREVWVGGAIRATDGGVLWRWDGSRWGDESAGLGGATSFAAVTDLAILPGGTGIVAGTNVGSRLVVARRAGGRFTVETLSGTASDPFVGTPVVAVGDATSGTLWLAGYRGLLHRLDGGRWSSTTLGGSPVLALRFVSLALGWALTAHHLHHFDGTGWSLAHTPVVTGMHDIAAAPDGILLLATTSGTFRRQPGGAWAELRDSLGRPVPSRRAALVNAGEGWVVTDAGLARLTASALIPVTLPATSTLVAVATGTGGGAWALGYTGDFANGYSTVVYRYR